MLIFFNTILVLNYSITYLFLYNISILTLVLIIWSDYSKSFKTLNNFTKFSSLIHKKYIILILLFSIAGVPPLVGFFLKLNLLVFIGLNSIFIYLIILSFLFSILFFYLQNLKYLLITNNIKLKNYSVENLNKNIYKTYIIFINMVLLTFGLFLLDDIIIFFYWLLY